MLTMDGYMLICTREAVIETADFLGGMGKSWDSTSNKLSMRYEDRQTGGGAVRMTWRAVEGAGQGMGVCWLSRHSGYNVDRTSEAYQVLTILFDAVPIKEGDTYGDRHVYFTDFQGDDWRNKFVVENGVLFENKADRW